METLLDEWELVEQLAQYGFDGQSARARYALMTIEAFIEKKLAEGYQLDLKLASFYPKLSGALSARDEDPETDGLYVQGAGNREWRMCVSRHYLEEGMDTLFVSKDAALPMEDRFCNRDLVSVKERVYRFGFGVNERRYLPIVKRTIYIHNCGVLFPLDDFA